MHFCLFIIVFVWIVYYWRVFCLKILRNYCKYVLFSIFLYYLYCHKINLCLKNLKSPLSSVNLIYTKLTGRHRIMTCVTLSSVRTESTKSPGLLWDSRTRNEPFFPRSSINFSASLPERLPWNHLQKDEEILFYNWILKM